jgi:hypothetical protein
MRAQTRDRRFDLLKCAHFFRKVAAGTRALKLVQQKIATYRTVSSHLETVPGEKFGVEGGLLRGQPSHAPTIVSFPATALDNLSSSSGASGRMCSSRFVRARIRITGIRNFFSSCCAASFRSTVTNTSNSFSASSSNSPFLIPLQPCFGTVVTAWLTSERAKRAGTHSSRCSHGAREHAFFSFFEKGDDLVAPNAGKILQKLVNRIAAFEVIDQVLDRHAGAGKARRAAHDFGIDFDD